MEEAHGDLRERGFKLGLRKKEKDKRKKSFLDLNVRGELLEEGDDGRHLHVDHEVLGAGVRAVLVEDRPHLGVGLLLFGGEEGEGSRLVRTIRIPCCDHVHLERKKRV